MSIVVDTGVLLAAADSDDDHQVCARLLREHRGELWVPEPVIPGCAWQVERNVNQRCADLVETYADLGLGVVDASVVTVAENLSARTLATLNWRDFAMVRPLSRPCR